ncbi:MULTISPECIES: sensor histidine kinase [unclassified Sphingomonas]|uniref:sensor histidine kinase n=1 Tax=unclassified Sphingomonas TaxID=196159 RepID=UPI0017825FC0|nr:MULTISPECIES: HAMP domain-containing sensor histidine kinase [unclassified Sphingomonas]MBD8640723.1 HAMP domain-containing histidine kinase [Sphingomonas sp. CFBP 13733]MBP2514913.1 signal transduction histidine kinase [Sphingomonas sp. PvP018]
MALLIALALFVAQAINFGLILRDRTEFRLAQATRPVATRIADALEREAHAGRPLTADRGRVRRLATNPIAPFAYQRHPEVAAELRRQLADQGLTVGRIDTGLRPVSDDDAEPRRRKGLRNTNRQGDRQGDRQGGTLVIAVEQPGRGWLAITAPWPQPGWRLLFALLSQTAILYVIVLLPVLWIVRRMSRPLRDLRAAAEAFRPGEPGIALSVRGPDDVAALVAAFNALRLRVTAMLDEKDRMLGAIGHDLRTPLAALRVRIESVEDDTDRTRMADTIAEMNRTLDDILSLARLGRPSEPPTDVDLAALVDAVVEDFRDIGDNVTFVEAGRLRMHLRPSLIRRAVRNLIENAVKYGVSAEVRVEADARRVAIIVADQGPGIPEDRMGDVFDAFTRLETSRNRETGGIGLGLALARAIIREAGGEIRLVNRTGGGLDAIIELPR